MKQWLKPGDRWDQLGGGLDPEMDGAFLRRLAERIARPGMIGFDTGCFTGWTASQVWDVFHANGGHFYCVDWFRGGPESRVGTFWWPEIAEKDSTKEAYPADRVLLQLLKNIEVMNATDFVSVIIADSWRPAELIANGSIDYVYIGGDHRYTGFMKDMTTWIPKVRPGGIICGHALDHWEIQPGGDLWRQLCAQPEQDYYVDGRCHFGINRGLYELFIGKQIIRSGNCWAKVIGD